MTTTRIATAAALCTVLAACGGGGGSPPANAADTRSFSYAEPRAAYGDESAALEAELSSALAARATPDLSQADGLADFSGLTAVLLGDYGDLAPMALQAGSPRPVVAVGLAGDVTAPSGFDDPDCVTATATRVQLNACRVTVDIDTMSEVVTVGGFLDASDALTWNLTVGVELTDTASAATASARYHNSGSLTVTDTTVVGQALASMTVDVTAEGQHVGFQVDESLDLDVTYQADPECITGGTLEAKRVWKVRPAGATPAELPDRGALVTWSGCGAASIAASVN